MQTFIAPIAGQILRGRFPEMEHVLDEDAGKDGRPCLVLEVATGRDGQPEVLVAYGTSQHTGRFGLGEFVLTKKEAPFLAKDTKFCLMRRLWLPLAKFANRDGQPDVAGALPRNVLARVKQAAIEAGLV